MITSLKPESLESTLTPELKAFIDGAIVPALIKVWVAENRRPKPLAPIANGEENASHLISDELPSAEEGVTL